MTTTSPDTGTTPTTDALRVLVDDVLLSVAADDTNRYAGGTPAGRALLSLAALARRAAAALATESAALDGAPGSAVRQEFADAARLLSEAADSAHGESWQVADVLVRAERVQAELAAGGG